MRALLVAILPLAAGALGACAMETLTNGTSDGTVRWHLRHVYDKLHVRSRTEAALKFRSARQEDLSPGGTTHL